jgi:enoyl-CoA hydratase
MAEEELVVEVRGRVGRILLNRPRKLNCLSLGMIRRMREVLQDWDRPDSGVLAVVVRGAGRAFCSGGDVVSLYHGDAELQAQYVKEEYSLDLEISRLTVPYIAVMDGVTMGGGCGISVNGR